MTKTKDDNKLDLKGISLVFLLGSAFGTTTLLISELSQVLFRVPLYLSPISIKNILKTWFINGGTLAGLVLISDNLGINTVNVSVSLDE